MKRTIIAAAASLLALGAVAYAQAPGAGPGAPGERPRMEERMRERMERRAERMEERMDRRLERLKSNLKLTPQQEPLWAPVEQQLRRVQQERRDYWRSNMERMRDAQLPDRLDLMAERMASNATGMRELSNAVKPLWATLSDEQKQAVRRALPGRGAGREDRRGEGHWGPHHGHGEHRG